MMAQKGCQNVPEGDKRFQKLSHAAKSSHMLCRFRPDSDFDSDSLLEGDSDGDSDSYYCYCHRDAISAAFKRCL